jgi:hypothetical protein
MSGDEKEHEGEELEYKKNELSELRVRRRVACTILYREAHK